MAVNEFHKYPMLVTKNDLHKKGKTTSILKVPNTSGNISKSHSSFLVLNSLSQLNSHSAIFLMNIYIYVYIKPLNVD